MTVDKLLEIVEQDLLSRALTPLERLVFQQSWLGQGYNAMAHNSGYEGNYVKEVGSQLWHELSKALGRRVTKKNLHLVFGQYETIQASKSQSIIQREPQQSALITVEKHLAFTSDELEFPSVPLASNSRLYINRPPIEELCYAELHKSGCIIRIRAPKRMGKSSLLNQILDYATQQNYRTVYLDFLEADKTSFASLDRFLRWFCINVTHQLNLTSKLANYWDEEMGSKMSCKFYFGEYLLRQINRPIVIVINEINRLFEYPDIAQDFLPMLRSWHEQAQQVETWHKLRLVIAQSTEVYIPLKLHQSPFNVGLAITLPPFTLIQIQELAERYGLQWRNETGIRDAEALMTLVGGHPYLVNIALYHLSRAELTLAELMQSAATQAGVYSHHLRSYLVLLQNQPELIAALEQVVTASEGVHLEANIAHKLENMGLIQLKENWAKPTCELYRRYFSEQIRECYTSNSDKSLDRKNGSLGFWEASPSNEASSLVVNYQHFEQYIETHWWQWVQQATPVALLLCKVDYFKFYSDIYGVRAGNACLEILTNIIYDCVEQQVNQITQYEDAKFAILLSYADINTAKTIAENIRDSVKALAIPLDQSKVGGFPEEVLTVSLGIVSTVAMPHTAPSTLIKTAEAALQQAKRQGGNRVIVSQSL